MSEKVRETMTCHICGETVPMSHVTPEWQRKHEHQDEILTEHFIVVRVKHTEAEDARVVTPMGRARQALHDASQQYDINLTDMVLKAGESRDYIGRPILRDYLMVQALVTRTMEDWKAAAAGVRPRTHSHITGKPLRRSTPEEKAKRAHRARALRALAVVKDYEATYNEELKRG